MGPEVTVGRILHADPQTQLFRFVRNGFDLGNQDVVVGLHPRYDGAGFTGFVTDFNVDITTGQKTLRSLNDEQG